MNRSHAREEVNNNVIVVDKRQVTLRTQLWEMYNTNSLKDTCCVVCNTGTDGYYNTQFTMSLYLALALARSLAFYVVQRCNANCDFAIRSHCA